MTKEIDNYKAFAGVNLSNARSENESYEDYKKRLKQNEGILKLYNTIGRDAFKELFPAGVGEALKMTPEENSLNCDLGGFYVHKKMRDVRTIIFAAESRRDLCYVSENKGFRFTKRQHFGPRASNWLWPKKP